MKTLAILAGGALLFVSAPAAANGRFPLANQIVFSPTDPNLIVLRTSYGILPSHDNGATWQYVCEGALGIGPSTLLDPSIGLTHDNSLLAGVELGLNVSPDVGCNWNCIGGPLAGALIADLAVRPDSPSGAVAITGTYVVNADSGQELHDSRVFETTDDGVTWTALGGAIDPAVSVYTIDVTKTDPNRLYVSGTRGFGLDRTASLFVSKDKGQTWAERPLPSLEFDPATEDEIFIGGVDPTNADRLYLRSSGLSTGGRSRLTAVTLAADGTPAFSTARIFDVEAGPAGITGELLGFALSSDGSKVYVGSQQEGIWVAEAADLAFHQKNAKVHVQCLATRGSELWACAPAEDGFVAGVSLDDGQTFSAKLPLIGSLSGAVACAPSATGSACGEDANASQCGTAFEAFCGQYTCGAPSTTSLDASPNRSSSSCDLAVVGGGGAAGFCAAFSLIGIAVKRRRRR
jgi:hypothetical protein